MQLKDRVTIISEKNYNRILKLYGELNTDDLERFVNNHVAVALDEIEEDLLSKNGIQLSNATTVGEVMKLKNYSNFIPIIK